MKCLKPFSLDITHLRRVHFSQIGEKTKIKVIVSYSLVDWKNIFELLALFSSNALDKELPEQLKIKKINLYYINFGKVIVSQKK